MYDELVKSLRQCAEASCAGCKNDLVEIGCRGKLQREAADAIEELQKAVNFHKFNSELWEDKYNSLADEKWIPVTERLPKEMETVLVTDGKNVGWSFCVNDYGTMEFYSPWTVTHWMPLPEPPKEE